MMISGKLKYNSKIKIQEFHLRDEVLTINYSNPKFNPIILVLNKVKCLSILWHKFESTSKFEMKYT